KERGQRNVHWSLCPGRTTAATRTEHSALGRTRWCQLSRSTLGRDCARWGRDGYTIFDDIWAWRADHGNGVGWTSNTSDTGVIVNGGNVTAYGLFVEHFQKYEVLERRQRHRRVLPERDDV